MRSFRKGLELFIVYIVLIIGIFVLQFRTDSNILEKIGNLQVTLARLENSEDSSSLQNKLQISYNGLSFHSDEQNSAKVLVKGANSSKNVKLVSYSKSDDQKKITFVFQPDAKNSTSDIKLNFEVTSDELDAPLSIYVDFPSDIESFYLPYNLSYSLKIQKEETNRVILSSKKSQWALTSNQLADGYLCMTSKDTAAHFAIYDDTKKFSLDMITELAVANEEMYKGNVSKFVSNMTSLFKKALSEGSFTEQEVVAYVAAKAEDGKYADVLEEIPSSFKKSSKRTYLSAPYFNNLTDMNVTLEKAVRESDTNISVKAKADASSSIDIFTETNIASKLCIHPDRSEVQTLIENATAADLANASIPLITGIIKAYVDFAVYESEYADMLQGAIAKCFEKLENSCSIEDDKLIISDNGQFINVIQGIQTGLAVMRYGEVTGNQTYTNIGYAIINTYFQDTTLDLRSSAALYPMIKYNNWYYPHYAVVNSDINDYMWAWTCAETVTQARDSDDNLTLVVNFPVGYIHYLMVKGLPKFSSIYIYDIAFRTDPRFESYNSSGYVYKEDTLTLLLKSRQKSQYETVKMYYTGLPSRKSSSFKKSGTSEAADNASESTAKEEKVTKPASSQKANQKYSVILGVCPEKKKKAIIAEIRAARPDLSATEANKLFASAPTTLKEDLTLEEADSIVVKIINAGGVASKK